VRCCKRPSFRAREAPVKKRVKIPKKAGIPGKS
jgi:hypothetical protein